MFFAYSGSANYGFFGRLDIASPHNSYPRQIQILGYADHRASDDLPLNNKFSTVLLPVLPVPNLHSAESKLEEAINLRAKQYSRRE